MLVNFSYKWKLYRFFIIVILSILLICTYYSYDQQLNTSPQNFITYIQKKYNNTEIHTVNSGHNYTNRKLLQLQYVGSKHQIIKIVHFINSLNVDIKYVYINANKLQILFINKGNQPKKIYRYSLNFKNKPKNLAKKKHYKSSYFCIK